MIVKEINNLDEMKKYYDKNTNTYIFKENGDYIDLVIFHYNLKVASNIDARDIYVCNINVVNINAHNIDASDVIAVSIKVNNINAYDIVVCDIDAHNIDANDINTLDIKAHYIDANDIYARNIEYKKVIDKYE